MAKSRLNWPSLVLALAGVAFASVNAQAIVIATPGDTYDTWINPGAGGIHYAADGVSTTGPARPLESGMAWQCLI